MTTYTLRISDDGYSTEETIEAATQNEAEQIASDKADEWLETGDWDTSGGTLYLRARWSLRDEDGQKVADGVANLTLQPDAPKCVDGKRDTHDWQSPYEIVGGIKENPGVWGHGGGVKIAEVCMRCGCGRHTDTWAQNPSTGEQGLESVSYEAGEFSEEIADMETA